MFSSIPLSANPSASSSAPPPPLPTTHIHPRTPSFDSNINSSPIFSSPDTPKDKHSGVGRKLDSMGEFGLAVEEEGGGEVEGLGFGLVPKAVLTDVNRQVESIEQKRDLGVGTSRGASETPRQRDVSRMDGEALHEEEDDMEDFPTADQLRSMKIKLDAVEAIDGDVTSQRDEYKNMARRLLHPAINQLPFLRSQIEAQRETIRTLQQQAKLSDQLVRIERDRHAAEKSGWRAEAQALNRVKEADIAAGTRPKRVLDLDVGYHLELEAANKRLEMDNRLMAPRLEDTQRQIDRLVTELRHLRSHVVLTTGTLAPQPFDINSLPQFPPLAQGQPMGTLPQMPQTSYQKMAPPPLLPQMPPSERKPQITKATAHATMGDARTEHLLLAARKVRSMRAQNYTVGRLTLDELKRGGVVGPDGGVGYTEGYGESIDEDMEVEMDSDYDERSSERRGSISARGLSSTPLLPRAKRGGRYALPPPTTPRSKKTARPQTTPGGGNFNDLLRAAEMATRPATPTPPGGKTKAMPMSVMQSATRSTNRHHDESNSDRGSPVKKRRRVPGADEHYDEELDESSALDLLAQASQLDVAQSQETSDQGDAPTTSQGSLLGPAIDLRPNSLSSQQKSIEDHQIDPALSTLDDRRSSITIPALTPKMRPRAMSNVSASELHTPARRFETYDETPRFSPPSSVQREMQEPPLGAYASPTGATVPGLGKYVHLTSSMPARRIRSPYLKWTVEEDELLARAVALHGEKWDLVSKGVPTRSYHQVRQRWLRKTGAFDKKPVVSQEIQDNALADDDEDGSPTPASGTASKTPLGKKRKASLSAVKL